MSYFSLYKPMAHFQGHLKNSSRCRILIILIYVLEGEGWITKIPAFSSDDVIRSLYIVILWYKNYLILILFKLDRCRIRGGHPPSWMCYLIM